MAKVRVHELAKELGVESKELLAHLKAQGEFLSPALSTIVIPMRKIGEEALVLMQETARRRATGEPFVPRKIELGCELVLRASTDVPAKG